MRNILVVQHVAHEILGTLNPLLKTHGLRIKYVNFGRNPTAAPSLEGYNGLIILGGPMGVYDSDQYPHIKAELRLIEEALKKEIPVLGICLGSQLIAHVLGAHVRRGHAMEVGWHDVQMTPSGLADPLFSHFTESEKIFQLHGDTFDVPRAAEHLAFSNLFEGQAFRYGKKVYGLQFHLEVDAAMIQRWLKVPVIQNDILALNGQVTPEQILLETQKFIERSVEMSQKTFSAFIDLFGLEERPIILGSGHGKPRGQLK